MFKTIYYCVEGGGTVETLVLTLRVTVKNDGSSPK